MPTNPLPLSDQFFALGALEGVVLLDRKVLIASNGEEFPIAMASHYKRWAEKDPEAVASARHHLVWPRTTKEGLHLTLTKSGPKRFPGPTPGTFRISGEITNQRGQRNQVVVRVKRNSPAKGKRYRLTEFRPHLLFLKGRLTPACKFINHHVSLIGALDGRDIAIRVVRSIGAIQEHVFEFNGVKFPWPFASSRASIERFCQLNGKGDSRVLVMPGFRVKLKAHLESWETLQKTNAWDFRKTSESERMEIDFETGEPILDPKTGEPLIEGELPNREELERDNDRLRHILKRIDGFTKRLPDGDLEALLEDTGLLQVLNSARRAPFFAGTSINPFDHRLSDNPRRAARKVKKEKAEELTAQEKMLTAEKPVVEAKTSSGKVKIMHLLPEEMRDFAKDALRGMNDAGLATKHGIYPQTVRIWANTLVNSGWLAAVPDHLVKQIRSHQILKAAGLKTNG